MGMSASQARLIALTARMSDTEYEAQQINQQRLTLSNKMNEVYEAMCNMDVPTPPSKLDYATNAYSGKIGNSNIEVRPDSEGVPRAYREMNGVVVDTTHGRKGGNVKIKLSDAANVTKGTNKPQANYHPLKKVQIAPGDDGYQNYINQNQLGTPVYKKDNEGNNLTDGSGDNIVDHYESSATYDIKDENGKQQYAVDETKWAVTTDVESFKYAEDNTITPSFYINQNGSEPCSASEFKDKFYGGYTDDQISNMCSKYFVVDGTDARQLDKDKDFDEYGRLKDDVKLMEENDKGKSFSNTSAKIDSNTVTSADGSKTGTISEISAAESKDGFDTAFQALKNTNHTKTEDELKDAFYAVDYGDGTFAFVLKTDNDDSDRDVLVYEVGKGAYKEAMADGDYKITYDNSGNINGITTTAGAQSALTQTQAYDELAYDKAMATYTAEKNEYDQEQNKLNKQTSIYQRQDKMLELKLTRLDNERNALNTEIEAVKKVIQDAIDRGFKTFSG